MLTLSFRFAPYFSFLQDKLEYEFKEIGLLQRAMCSKNSLWYGVENFSQGESNERMEFLGTGLVIHRLRCPLMA